METDDDTGCRETRHVVLFGVSTTTNHTERERERESLKKKQKNKKNWGHLGILTSFSCLS